MVERQHFSKTEDINEAMNRFRHLREYVNEISRKEGMPEFKVQLDRSLRNLENPNIIYPVGDPIFIHLSKGAGDNVKYKVIIPQLTSEEKDSYDAILDRIIEVAHTAKVPNSQEELRDVLISLYNEVITIRNPPEKPSFLNMLGKKIAISEEQYHNILFHLIKDRLGYAKLEPLLRDMYIEDISCIGVGSVWIVHKIFGSIETSVEFVNDIELNKYIVESSERVERPVSEAHPIVDAIMPDGSRVNFIYSRKISLQGSSFTIRKFNETPISVCNLVNWGTWSAELGAYLWLCCENGISVFVCGETASGKTTTLNAMTTFIPMDNKVYTVEQTPEITLPHPIWQHLITRESGEKTDVTMFDLLIASLRSRPDYIIVGEIRGKEANITFQAMQTGHPVISTFHAGSVHSMIQRLTGDPINIPIAFIDNLNIVLIQSAVYVNGKVERRVLSVTEVIKYNDEVKKVLTKEVFQWDGTKDKHNFRGLYNSFMLEQKIAKHVGLKDSREIYDIMRKRSKIIERMIEQNIMDYFEVVKLLKKYKEEGDKSLPFSI
ncbi:type II/IV secretion system ATPase subunit [Candidatus Woesearchaeota archaeon]|nr:type II/IV secretion system ATPase subunit [Nanoarchaeota archaeon]MCB9370180.1 type II/IV secretion system ATPase subunit [Candidatus Woesearchaeota archaeon]USN44710.1 MAG: type II/IV secretion system ATPase subunit [Candidatus Woesearchaeota archaeon]